MDYPNIRGSGINTSQSHNMTQRTSRIQGDADAGKAPVSTGPRADQNAKIDTAKTEIQKTDAEFASHIEEHLPLPILAREGLQQIEWAWRRLLVQISSSGASENGAEPFKSTEAGGRSVIESLWSAIVEYAADPSENEWGTAWGSALTDPVIIPFSDFKPHHFKQLPSKVQKWLLADRLTSSVQTPTAGVSGEGVVLLPGLESHETAEALRWKAERQSKRATDGSLVHRLKIACQVTGSPVELTITFAKPTLMVHAATNDFYLKNDFERRGEALIGALRHLGVQVERFSVGSLTEDEDS